MATPIVGNKRSVKSDHRRDHLVRDEGSFCTRSWAIGRWAGLLHELRKQGLHVHGEVALQWFITG